MNITRKNSKANPMSRAAADQILPVMTRLIAKAVNAFNKIFATCRRANRNAIDAAVANAFDRELARSPNGDADGDKTSIRKS